jgi:hypothetical protein
MSLVPSLKTFGETASSAMPARARSTGGVVGEALAAIDQEKDLFLA